MWWSWATDGTVKKQAVTVGIRTANAVQILSGLSPASTVVTEGGYGLDNGTKVSVGVNVGKPAAAGEGKE